MTKSNTANHDYEWELSPESYVASLYRSVLKREPDDEGLAAHVAALRAHGDPTKILNAFLSSQELMDLKAREIQQRLEHQKYFGSADDQRAPLDTKEIIECSLGHFDDLSFIQNIKNRNAIYGRTIRKIKTIAVYYPKMSNGGTERVTASQIVAWQSLGLKVILITDLPADPENDYDYGGAERHIIPPKMMHNHDYRDRGHALRKILDSNSVDLFVNNLWDETSTVWDILVAKSMGIPAIVGWHNIFDTRIREPNDLHLANIRISGYAHADLVTVLSTVDKLWFDSRGVPARVSYNPLTFGKLPARTAPLTGKTVVWVARAERHQKRLDLAIRMFPMVLQKVPDATLLIVGGGPDLEWAKEYASSLGISKHVEFTGYTTNVAQYLARSDVHILTSEFEGWCLALGEAWAYGVPSVMFELPYLEYVQSGRGHVAVKMHNIQAMAEAVSGLLLDPSRRRQLGKEAREVAKEFHGTPFKEEWRKILKDMEAKTDATVPISQEEQLRGYRALTKALGDRFLALTAHEREHYVPRLPSAAPVQKPKKASTRRLVKFARLAAAPYVLAKRSVEKAFLPETRLRMIDLSHVGLGDNLMIWAGLFTLLKNGAPVCAPGCVLHVQPILADLASRIFSSFGLVVQRGRPEVQLSPIYTPLPPATRREWWATYVGRDWRMNWVEALDQQKTFPRDGADLSFKADVRLGLSERLLYKRHSWAEATPGYVGYRVWLPLALKHKVYPIVFLSQMKRSLTDLRKITADYVDEITPVSDRKTYSSPAAFPSGKSFQTIPPLVYKAIDSAMGGDFFTCYVQNDSPWKNDFEDHAVATKNLSDIKDTFRVIKYSSYLLTTDSFTSHLAQFLRDDFTLVLSRDLQESILHPGANPTVVANHPACAPCNYQERYHFDRCVAGYKYCLGFESDAFVSRIASAVRMRAIA
ncbi:glycosyltransferase [Brevundimonas sp. TSRC1-1]|uniref:glycosyltransferase n=1 Tax=Brevundimonas sp. TSRC1-1 TaxID=2804562 RepID=UPI003CEF800B